MEWTQNVRIAVEKQNWSRRKLWRGFNRVVQEMERSWLRSLPDLSSIKEKNL